MGKGHRNKSFKRFRNKIHYLYHIEEMSLREVAKKVKCSVGTVRYWLEQ